MASELVLGLDNFALTLFFGLVFTWGFLLHTTELDTGLAERFEKRAIRLTWWVLVLFWFTSLLWLWARTQSMSGLSLFQAWRLIPKALDHSHFGSVWWLRLVALVFISFSFWLKRFQQQALSRRIALAMLAGFILAAVARAASGHAAAAGDWTLHEGMDLLHLFSISLWGGIILGALTLALPYLKKAPVAKAAAYARRLSFWASLALAIVLLTGIYNSWQMLDSWRDFWTSDYGRLLAIKLIAVAGMLICGAINHYRLVPGLQTGQVCLAQLRRSLIIEAGLLLFVLFVTGFLIQQMPPLA